MKTSNQFQMLFFMVSLTLSFLLLSACKPPQEGDDTSNQAENVRNTEVLQRIDQEVDRSMAVALQQVERELRVVDPSASVGGQIVRQYLGGEIQAEEAVSQVFVDESAVLQNRFEMEMAIEQLRRDGDLSTQDEENILVLESLISMHLEAEIEAAKDQERITEYTVALAFGGAGAAFPTVVLNGVGYLRAQSNRVVSWLGLRTAAERTNIVFTRAVDRAYRIFGRTSGLVKTSAVVATAEEVATQKVSRVLGAELAPGVEVAAVVPDELPMMQALVFEETIEANFRLASISGPGFQYAKMTRPGLEPEYLKITGVGVEAPTQAGERVFVEPNLMIEILDSRLRNFSRNTLNFTTPGGQIVRTGIDESQGLKYISGNPMVREVTRRTAVGGSVAILSYLALQPFDIRYAYLEDYYDTLEDDGVIVVDE